MAVPPYPNNNAPFDADFSTHETPAFIISGAATNAVEVQPITFSDFVNLGSYFFSFAFIMFPEIVEVIIPKVPPLYLLL